MQDECKRVQNKRRGIRRHHKERIIKKIKRILENRYFYSKHDKSDYSKIANSGIGCGCWQCANPRRGRGYGEPRLTVQERREFQYDWEDEVSLFRDIK